MEKNYKYDEKTIYFTLKRNIKRIYDQIPYEEQGNLSKSEFFAREIGISPSFLYHLFSAKSNNENPSFSVIISICNIFDCSIEELLKPLSEKEYQEYYDYLKKKRSTKTSSNE